MRDLYDIAAQLPVKVTNAIILLTGTITFIDSLDVLIRILTGVVTLILGFFGILHYIRKARINKLDEQIKQQQLYDIIEANKKKHG